MLAFVLSALIGQGSSLLAHAKFVCDTTDWKSRHGLAGHYRWLNTHELIYLTGEKTSHWMKLDVGTHRATNFGPIATVEDLTEAMELPTASPDGKHLLWRIFRKGKPEFVVTESSGQFVGRWPVHASQTDLDTWEENSCANWTSDSQSIIECVCRFGTDGHMDVWRRSLSDINHEIAYPHVAKLEDLAVWSDPKEAKDGRLVWAFQDWIGSNRPKPIYSWPPGNPGNISKALVSWPRETNFAECQLSPDAQKIVWDIDFKDNYDHELFVTRADGSARTSLGRMEFRATGPLPHESFGEIQWVPGGGAISFVCQGKLYEVDVPY